MGTGGKPMPLPILTNSEKAIHPKIRAVIHEIAERLYQRNPAVEYGLCHNEAVAIAIRLLDAVDEVNR